MTPRTRLPILLSPKQTCGRGYIVLVAVVATFALATCGGGGGSSSHTDPNNVAISGVVEDGSGSATIANATCRFVDTDGQTRATDAGDQGGHYTLSVPPAVQGYIYCSPPSMPQLNLATFASTMGADPGSAITSENLTPATTIAADIIRNADPSISPEARKLDLLLKIQTEEDPDLNIVVAMATRLYRAMLAQQVNVGFGSGDSGRNGSGDGGGESDSDVGGVGGDAGDGADFSPLAGVQCTFLVGDDLAQAEVTYSSALADYLSDGQLDRPDLVDLANTVNQGLDYAPEEIQQAFVHIFTKGLGQPYTTVTDEAGHYFLPIPANLPGFVRCAYPEQPELALATYVPGRSPDELLENQDASPAATVFSALIAPQIEEDLAGTKENFLADIEGLGVFLTGPNLPQGPLTGIRLGDAAPQNNDVGLVAFTATALFNSFYKNGLEAEYTTIIQALSDNLTTDLTVDPAFLESQGLPPEQAALVSDSIKTAGEQLGTELPKALSTARVNVTVTDADDGDRLVENAVVEIPGLDSSVICEGCGGSTDANGRLTLTLINIPEDPATEVVVTISSVPGYETVTAPSIEVVALATVDLEVALSTATTFDLNVQGSGEGGGSITSTPAGIDCTIAAGALAGDGSEPYADGTEVVLTATPDGYSAFGGWSGDACVDAGSTCTLTMEADITVTANFTPSCNPAEYTIEPSQVSFPQEGGSGTLAISAPEGCPWSVSADEWISIDPETAIGSGGGIVNYTINANSGSSRSGTIAAAGQNFSVDQEAGDCTYTLTPTSANPAAAEGTGSITVTPSYAGCTTPWTASESAGWINITAGANGNGPGTVSYTVAANTGPSRSATITVAGRSHQVTQAAASCTYTITPTSASPSAAGGTGSITVTPSYTGCTTPWTASESAGWINITAGANGSGEGTVSYSVDPNNGPSRSATITVAGHDFTVNQSDPYVVDQQNWPPFSPQVEISNVALNHYWPRQRFTPGLNRLTGVDIYLETIDAANGDEVVLVKILGDGGELGRKTLTVQAGFNGLIHFNFDTPIVIPSGQTASLFVLNSLDSTLKSSSTFGWRLSRLEGGGTYSGGAAWHSDYIHASEDFFFRTYGYNQ